MKVILSTLLLSVTCSVQAEIVFGTTNTPGRVIISTNEAIVVTASISEFSGENLSGADAAIVQDGKTNLLRIPSQGLTTFTYCPVILAGPMEFAIRPPNGVTNEFAMISFRRFRSVSVHTHLVPPGSNFSITVSSNQSVQFFPALGFDGPPSMEVSTIAGHAQLQILSAQNSKAPRRFDLLACRQMGFLTSER